jgi:hypothetical protein
MFIGSSAITCFSAYLALDTDGTPNFIINKISDFKIDRLSIELFEDIIYGRIENTYLDENYDRFSIEINEENAIKNVEKYVELQSRGLFPNKIKLDKLNEVDIVGIRFQGRSYNLKYSISNKAANKFEDISKKIIKNLETYTNSKKFYRANNKAASTMIRFTNESIDDSIEPIISRLSTDIRNKTIDLEYMNSEEGTLYKQLLKTLKDVSTIDELDTFEIYINNNPYLITNFAYLYDVSRELYGTQVIGKGIKKGISYIDDGKLISLTLDLTEFNGEELDTKKTFYLHVPTSNLLMAKNAKDSAIYDERVLLRFEATLSSEQTADCSSLIVITEGR